MTSVKVKRIQPGYEPIKGYVLEKRIGRGGYGEVWRAEAPGGIKKAVKFVFGQQDERRAEQELKSLERIKSVQHPFILTLERFELIENQLVIVTELADGSLEDIYKQHLARGSCGIPRDALLGYMRDAADALDYLHQLYKLQHLDIKPANLLIIGGRVKVADFGLLKDLGDVECSLVGGLTPIYAPPEVFDGRPSMHSDQYSLAVMFQELLTSTRPFGGRTIAQLATQHVHNAPNLNPLPASDRPCVARALEKSPDRRFASCTEFVDKLVHPRSCQTGASQAVPAKEPSAVHVVENLPQLDGIGDVRPDVAKTHALVVALGGTGADCLGGLRSRIYEFGAASPMVLHSVLIDTNPMTTQAAAMIDDTQIIPRCRVVEARLRTPNDYRNGGTGRLRTISRRWIYNVPRNSQTGGMRPLGRLALVDHGQQVLQTLRAAVNELKQSRGEAADLKIYVVASLTGGTGSGMYIDIAYLLRHLLDESELENEAIVSFLTTNRFQGDPSRPLALHATKSAIKEFQYFLKPGNGYPGDEGAGWPSVPAARTPLHHAYIIAQSDRPGAPTPLNSVIEYLWADATVCGEWFAGGRSHAEDVAAGTTAVRTLSVAQIGDPGDRQSSLLAPHCVKLLLLRWLGNPKDTRSSAKEFSARILRRCYLSSDSLCGEASRWIGRDRQERRAKIIEHLKTMDPALLLNRSAVQSRLATWLAALIDVDQIEVFVGQVVGQIRRELDSRLQDGRLDLASTLSGLCEIREHVSQSHASLAQKSDEELQRLGGTARPRNADPGSVDHAIPDRPSTPLQDACDLGEQLVAIIACRTAASLASALQDALCQMVESYEDASARIAQVIQRLAEGSAVAAEQWSAIDESIQKQLPLILDHLHAANVTGPLFTVIRAPESIMLDSIISELNISAAVLVRNLIGALNAGRTHDSKSADSSGTTTLHMVNRQGGTANPCFGKTTCLDSTNETIEMAQTHSWSASKASPTLTAEAALESVRPPLLECGGKQRLYLICRDDFEQKTLLSQLQGDKDLPLTKILSKSSMPMLVQEAQGIDLKNVLSWLDALTGDDGRISDRLATRCDVDLS